MIIDNARIKTKEQQKKADKIRTCKTKKEFVDYAPMLSYGIIIVGGIIMWVIYLIY